MDRLGLSVQRAYDRHLFCRELFRRLLVAQSVDVLAVIQNVRGAMRENAGNGALGVRRSHLHVGMIGFGAHTVGNDAGERLLPRGRGQRGNYEKTKDQRLHNWFFHVTAEILA